ncbi:hypothetical protein BJX96DRAFT_18760 [Aspergillus floccosus]
MITPAKNRRKDDDDWAELMPGVQRWDWANRQEPGGGRVLLGGATDLLCLRSIVFLFCVLRMHLETRSISQPYAQVMPASTHGVASPFCRPPFHGSPGFHAPDQSRHQHNRT